MNHLCRRCSYWGPGLGNRGYCQLREKQVWFGRKPEEPRARLERWTRNSPWGCGAFKELEPDWAHA